MNKVRVIFKEEENNYTTSVSDNTTEESARDYFVGTQFDTGVFPGENFQACIDIEFTPMPENLKKAKAWYRGLSINEQKEAQRSVLPPNMPRHMKESETSIQIMFNSLVDGGQSV